MFIGVSEMFNWYTFKLLKLSLTQKNAFQKENFPQSPFCLSPNIKNSNESFPQSLYVEKAMAASGASPEDIAKTLLIQVGKRFYLHSGWSKFKTVQIVSKETQSLREILF